MNQSTSNTSPSWSRSTRLIVGLIGLVILLALMWRFQALVGQIVVAAMLAYVLEPLVTRLASRTPLSRGMAALAVYLALTVVTLAAMGGIGAAAVNQGSTLAQRIPEFVDSVGALINRITASSIDIGPLHLPLGNLDWETVGPRIAELATPALGQGSQVAGQVAFGAIDLISWAAITFFISIYIEIDMPRLSGEAAAVALHSGYRDDYNRIAQDVSRVWSRYLRGQIILGILIAAITTIMLLALGVDGALALGLIAGALTVIPYVGPTVSAAMIIIVALFQPANYLGLAQLPYALVVGVVTLVVQQISGTLLLPMVVGGALNMSPLVVLVSLIAGAAVAGLLGVILAAPVAATLKIALGYVWRKLLDLPPFVDDEPKPGGMSKIIQRTAAISQRIARARFGAKPVNTAPEEGESQPAEEPQ